MKNFVREKSKNIGVRFRHNPLIKKSSFFGYRGPGLRRYHTIKRLWNFLVVRIQHMFGVIKVIGYPYYLVVEPTNICNLRCPLCPTGQGLIGREKGKLSFDNFKKIIDEIGKYIYFLRLENWGEPLLNEEISDMIKYAKARKISTSFNTNLTFLDEQNAKRLILSGLDHIKISLDGASSDSYARYRVGGDFNKIINNIRILVEEKAKLQAENPFIEIQFIMMKHNEHEIGKIKELCSELGADGLFIEGLRLDMRLELLNPVYSGMVNLEDWLPEKGHFSLYDYALKKRKNKTCNYLWTTTVINWDGSVVPCCSIFEQKYDFGNIFEENFLKIWNGSKYTAARGLMGRRGIMNKTNKLPCFNCFKNGVVS